MIAYMHQLGGNLVMLTPVGSVDPGFGVGIGGGVDPGYGHPTHPRPGHDLPHLPGVPDHSLPTTPPPHVQPGVILVLARDHAGVWHWAALPPGSPNPTPLPVPPLNATPKAG